MKKTEQYQLNQWELGDRVRMEDFNADNASLEAALGGKIGRMELIYNVNQSNYNGKDSLSAYFNVKNWGDWEYVVVFQDLHKTAFGEDDIFKMHLSGPVDYTDIHAEFVNLTGDSVLKAGSLVLVFFPRHNANNPIRGFVTGGGSGALFSDYTFNSVMGITVIMRTTSGLTSTRFVEPAAVVYGIR